MIKTSYKARIWLFIFTLLLVVFVLPFCARVQLTAVETVELFYACWSADDEKTANTLFSKHFLERHGEPFSFSDYLIYVNLISCEEVFYPEAVYIDRIEDMWGEKHTSAACVRAAFDIAYEENHGSGFDNTTYHGYYFYLVKKSPIMPWVIVAYGH